MAARVEIDGRSWSQSASTLAARCPDRKASCPLVSEAALDPTASRANRVESTRQPARRFASEDHHREAGGLLATSDAHLRRERICATEGDAVVAVRSS